MNVNKTQRLNVNTCVSIFYTPVQMYRNGDNLLVNLVLFIILKSTVISYMQAFFDLTLGQLRRKMLKDKTGNEETLMQFKTSVTVFSWITEL